MSQTHTLSSEETRQQAIRILRKGGVVVLPTDTLYGLSAAASSRQGLARIRAIKETSDPKQLILLAASVEMVESYVSGFGCTTKEAMAVVWPAPLTAVLPAGRRYANWAGGSVAVRVPALAGLSALIESLGEAIVSTSVNRSGEPPRTTPVEIEREFGREVDMIVAADAAAPARASTLVDFTGDAPRVLRQGDYAWVDDASGDANPSK